MNQKELESYIAGQCKYGARETDFERMLDEEFWQLQNCRDEKIIEPSGLDYFYTVKNYRP